VHGISVLGDVEILLNNAPRIREERPMRADTHAILVGLREIVGADRHQAAITNLHLAVELDKSLSLPTIFRAETAAAEDNDHRISSLQLGELSAFCRVVGKFVVGKNRTWDHIGPHCGILQNIFAYIGCFSALDRPDIDHVSTKQAAPRWHAACPS
jgi:hypothetical protein